ncbi:C2 domain-containing protein 5-like [Anneissia japonica]|uniref:C2 domain-containing protein 5-like n=1 Tax=Anneissia japonica TaxID=1529436 RepID=UPI0014258E6E|nr:C2 domain-containing protein 5-like [Anneissia japonica]
MPGKLKVRIIAARDLPIMDRASDLADAFVEVKFGQDIHKTEVCRKSLNPQWNTDWYKFEVDDEELQDEPLQIRVMDYDTYSAHDVIGKLYIDLNPLLWNEGASNISGWFPIYDTMHGVRGEMNVVVSVELFPDLNKFRQSSCGVQFFSTSQVPARHTMSSVLGFVEELVVNDDPEYQWIDKIRTPRASNEARQLLFSKISGQLQRKIGLKVLEIGGNAVLGYWQCFDLEGESGIVVRGIGTAALLQKMDTPLSPTSLSPPKDFYKELPSTSHDNQSESGSYESTGGSVKTWQGAPPSPTKGVPIKHHGSETDLAGSIGGGSSGSGGHRMSRSAPPLMNIDLLEYPFFTMTSFPTDFVVHLAGMVTARSVKLLDRIHNPDEPETRDAWWREIRTEIRSHANAMGCHAVVGYRETTTICDEICVLSASGTAAIVNVSLQQRNPAGILTVSLDRTEFIKEQQDATSVNDGMSESFHQDNVGTSCSLCHIPYKDSTLPFPVTLSKCQVCRKYKVPDILITTVEPPAELQYTGRGCFLQARICRPKKHAQGESNATQIGDALPFMEYELHRRIINKLKVKGMNALFGLRVQVIVGEELLVGTATGTAVYISALPPPSALKLTGKTGNIDEDDKKISSLQKRISDAIAKNKEQYNLTTTDHTTELTDSPKHTDSQLDVDDLGDSQLYRDAYIFEIDDADNKEIADALLEPDLPAGFFSCSTEKMPGDLNLTKQVQTVNLVWRQSMKQPSNQNLSRIFENLLESLCFKLRALYPCCLCSLQFDVALPEDEIIQIWVTAALLEVADSKSTPKKKGPRNSADADLMFAIEELSPPSPQQSQTPVKGVKSATKLDKKLQIKEMSVYPEVQLTPLPNIPGAHIDEYLGNINIFFIRESTSLTQGGGVNGFMHHFITEVNAMVRSHVAALGGNALVVYTMIDCILMENPHKNQCQCLVNVSGDAVHVQYDSDVMYIGQRVGESQGSSPRNIPQSES